MNKITIIIIAILAVLPLPLFAAEPPPLTTSELTSLLSGNSMAGNGKVNAPAPPYDWMAFYAPNGIMTMRLKPEWGGLSEDGQWWVTERGELCRKFTKMASGKVGCWLFYREGEFYRFIPSHGVAVEGRTAIIQGNLLLKK